MAGLLLVWGVAESSAAEEIRTTTTTTTVYGLPLQEPILFRIRGTLLQIPVGYLNPWPFPQQRLRGRINDWENVSFDFWMPDRRHLEVNPFSYVGFQPKEKGREPPGSDRYTVKVGHLELNSGDAQGHNSPVDSFRNLKSNLGPFSIHEEPFGLVRFWTTNWPYPQPEPFTNYHHLDGSDPQVLLRCTPQAKTPPFPLCDGKVQFEADRLAFHVVFPRDRLPEWRSIAGAVRDLVASWKPNQ